MNNYHRMAALALMNMRMALAEAAHAQDRVNSLVRLQNEGIATQLYPLTLAETDLAYWKGAALRWLESVHFWAKRAKQAAH